MNEIKKVDTRESLRVVTSNALIDASDLIQLSGNARKMFYLAISQCQKDDMAFYEYEITPRELADIWGISVQEIYQIAEPMTKELMKVVLTIYEGGKTFKHRHVFDKCDYDEKKIKFRLHTDMTDHLLGLKTNFSKPFVWDFMKMRSPFSMAIWHLMQKEMKSFKPCASQVIEYDISLEELRKVTGCTDKFAGLSEFKRFVLDKAIDEIKEKCLVRITYTNLKVGRTVTGFRFKAVSEWGYLDLENASPRKIKHLRKTELIKKSWSEQLTPAEQKELEMLEAELSQMTIEDLENKPVDE